MHRGSIVETGDTDTGLPHAAASLYQALLSAVPVADPKARGSRVRLKYVAES